MTKTVDGKWHWPRIEVDRQNSATTREISTELVSLQSIASILFLLLLLCSVVVLYCTVMESKICTNAKFGSIYYYNSNST